MSNLPDKVTGDSYTAAEFTEFKNEVQNAIASSGQALASSSVQLQQALARYASNSIFYTDSGSGNVYSLTRDTYTTPSVYEDGMCVFFVATHTNTATASVTLNALGVKSIKKNNWNNFVASGDIISGRLYQLVYKESQNAFNISGVGFLIDNGLPETAGAGYMIYNNGTEWVTLPPGSAGQVLTTNGAAAPSYKSNWLFASNGFHIFPSGITFQWGIIQNTGGDRDSFTVTFPRAYTVTPWAVVASALTDETGTPPTCAVAEVDILSSLTTFTYTLKFATAATARAVRVSWWAIGA